MAAVVDRDPGDEARDVYQTAVYQWRYRQARRIGYEEAAALQIAEAEIDVHELRDLIRRGCPLDLAVEITR